METTERTLRQKIDRVLEMLKPEYDWDKHWEQDGDVPSLEDLFRECTLLGWPEGDEAKKYCACGSVKVEDTPAALYRLLYLLKPANIDFSSMYKTHLFGFFSADKRFLVAVELYKYEIGLYLYCPQEAVSGKGRFVVGGWPGCANGWSCSDEDGKAFFEMIRQATDHTWQVYPGNNFEV